MDGLNNLSNNGSRKLSKWRKTKSNFSKRRLPLNKFKLFLKIPWKETPLLYLKANRLKLIQSQKRKSKKNHLVTMFLSCQEKPFWNTWVLKKKNLISKPDLDYLDNLRIPLLFKLCQEKLPSNSLNWDLTLKTLWRHLLRSLLNNNTKVMMIAKCQIKFFKITKVLIQTIFLNPIKNLSIKENSLLNNGPKKWRRKYLTEPLRRRWQRPDSSLKDNNSNKKDDRQACILSDIK